MSFDQFHVIGGLFIHFSFEYFEMSESDVHDEVTSSYLKNEYSNDPSRKCTKTGCFKIGRNSCWEGCLAVDTLGEGEGRARYCEDHKAHPHDQPSLSIPELSVGQAVLALYTGITIIKPLTVLFPFKNQIQTLISSLIYRTWFEIVLFWGN